MPHNSALLLLGQYEAFIKIVATATYFPEDSNETDGTA